MRRSFRSLTVTMICAIIVLLPGLPAWLQGEGPASRKIVYNLYATDGTVRLADGSTLRIYGFIGGQEGSPLVYLDEQGETRTLAAGAPAPATGAVTAAEAALAGHAQPIAPLVWAGAADVIELRLKNLGAVHPDFSAAALGIALRGIPGMAGEAAPETARLAVPANAGLPDAGNVLSYTFRVPVPGTYAYGWDYNSHLGHGGAGGMLMGSAGQPGQMCPAQVRAGCPCCARRIGLAGAGPVYAALDGGLIIYDAADPAAQTGPGMGAGGATLGLPYDEDYIMLITGGAGAQVTGAASPAMAGMAMSGLGQNERLLVNGRLPAAAAATAFLPNYRPFAAPLPAAGAARYVLVRIVNLAAQPQPVIAITQGHKAIGFRERLLDWSAAGPVTSSWVRGSDPVGGRADDYLLVRPGSALDVLLDLGAGLPAGSS